MNMGRPFPTLTRSAGEWWDVLIRACVIFALALIAAAVHPLALIVLIVVLYAMLDEKQLWLKSRLDRMEDAARAERLARSAGRAIRNV